MIQIHSTKLFYTEMERKKEKGTDVLNALLRFDDKILSKKKFSLSIIQTHTHTKYKHTYTRARTHTHKLAAACFFLF